jgi:type VI secretion system secreted protein Hcp
MPLDAFLKLDEPLLKGESTDDLHSDEIEILSFEQTVKRPRAASDSTQPDNRRGTTECSAITILKALDGSTPKLMESSCAGTIYKKATLTLCQPSAKSDGKRTDWKRITYFEVALQNVQITRVRLVGDPTIHLPVLQAPLLNSGLVAAMGPVEEVDLSYQKIKWTYKGSTGTANLTGMWSIIERTTS